MLDVRAFLEALVANGPRSLGSRGAETARKLLMAQVEALGLEPREEPFPLDYSLPRYSVLSSPAGKHRVLPAMGSADWPVKGEIRFVDSLDLERLGPVEGQILITPSQETVAFRERYLAVARSGAAAVILAYADQQFTDYPTTDPVWRPWAAEVRFPVAHIGPRTACHVAPGPGVYTPLIESGRTAAANVLWSLGDGDHDVYVLGHFDSLPEALGITDNGCGVAVMLRVTELLAGDLPRPLRVVFATTQGHESHMAAGGAKAFFERHHEDILARGVLAVDSDPQGAKLTLSAWFSNCPEWCGRIAGEARGRGLIVDVRETLASYSETFYLAQFMPAVRFWRMPFAGHCFFDDLSIVDFDQLEQVAQAMAATIRSVRPEDGDLPLTDRDADRAQWFSDEYGVPQPEVAGRCLSREELREARAAARRRS